MQHPGRLLVQGVPDTANRVKLVLFFTKIVRGSSDVAHVYYPIPNKSGQAVVEFDNVEVIVALLQGKDVTYVHYTDGKVTEPLQLSLYQGPSNPLVTLELDSFAINGIEINSQSDIDRIVEILQQPYIAFAKKMKILNLEEVVPSEIKNGKVVPSKLLGGGTKPPNLDFGDLHRAISDKMKKCAVQKVTKVFFPTDVTYAVPDSSMDPEAQARLYQFSPRYMPQPMKIRPEEYQSHVPQILANLHDEIVGHVKLIHLTHRATFKDLRNILTAVKEVRDRTMLSESLVLYVKMLDFMSKVEELPVLENVLIFTEKHDVAYVPSAMDSCLKEESSATNLKMAGLRILTRGHSNILAESIIHDMSELKDEQRELIYGVREERISTKHDLNEPPPSPSINMIYKDQFTFANSPKVRRLSGVEAAVVMEKRKRQRQGISDAFTSLAEPVFVNYPLKYANIEESLSALQKLCSDKCMSKPKVTVGILDTGISIFHNAFSKTQILAVQNFVRGNSLDALWDINGQGTHCCGILAGGNYEADVPDDAELLDDPNNFTNGVAPFVNLIVAKVLDKSGDGCSDSIAEGVEWMLQLEDHDPQYNVDIISISVGDIQYNRRLHDVISQAIVKGKVVVCASSNDEETHKTGIVYPARYGNTICVGSHNPKGQVSRFTPLGRELDFLAPGDDIWSASPTSTGAVKRLSGTAMATPFVSGIVAIVLSYAEAVGDKDLRNTVSNNAVMREILRLMSSSPGHHSEAYGFGSLNPWRVLEFGPQYFGHLVEKVVKGQVSTN